MTSVPLVGKFCNLEQMEGECIDLHVVILEELSVLRFVLNPPSSSLPGGWVPPCLHCYEHTFYLVL